MSTRNGDAQLDVRRRRGRAGSGRTHDDIVADIKREVRARLGIQIDVECHPTGALPRYEAKAIRVLHRAMAT